MIWSLSFIVNFIQMQMQGFCFRLRDWCDADQACDQEKQNLRPNLNSSPTASSDPEI